MPALSIRRMHDTLIMREILAEQPRAMMPTTSRLDWFDWIVTRPLKRGSGRKKVAVLYGYTKAEFRQWWLTNRQPGWTARVLFNPKESVRGPKHKAA